MAIETLEMLIEKFGDPIYRFSLKLTGSREDADDLYQETFLRAYEHLHKRPMKFRRRSSPATISRLPTGHLDIEVENDWPFRGQWCPGKLLTMRNTA